MVFTSWETDVGGQWTIYETDLEQGCTTWSVLESEGVVLGSLVGGISQPVPSGGKK